MRVLSATLALVVLLVLFSACSDSAVSPRSGDSISTEFPSAIGSSWTYEWEDRSRDETDTVVVSVVGELDSPEVGRTRVWVFQHAGQPDTVFMTTVDDTVRFLRDLTRSSSSTRFVFPLYAGAWWRGDIATDSSWVREKSVVSVPAGDFQGAFRVEESWGVTNSYGQVNTWVVPGIGIAMEDREERDLGPGPSYVRRLIAYELAEEEN